MSKYPRKKWRENVAEEMIRHIKAGTAPWQKPWKPGVIGHMQHNPKSDRAYRGINALWLEMQGYDDPRWMTLKQANELGAQVRAGEKAIQKTTRPMIGEDSAPVLDENGKPRNETVHLDRPRVFYANVFNAEQIDGLEPYKAPEPAFDLQDNAQTILETCGVKIVHEEQDRAFYHPALDEIHLPNQSAFTGSYEYYATAFHELGHATGHRDRLGRDFGPFGSETYAKEELRAEMASYITARDTGLGHYPERHAPYVESWVKAIEENPNVLFQAARDAEQIATWIKEPDLRPRLEKDAQSKRKVTTMERKSQQQQQEPAKATGYEAMVVHDWKIPEGQELRPGGADLVKRVGEYEMTVIPNGDDYVWEIRRDMNPKDMKSEYDNLVIQNTSADQAEAMADAEKHLREHIAKEAKQSQEKSQGKPRRVYLAVPYSEKDQAKEHGAKWDRKLKSWYAPEGVDMAPLEKWKPENQQTPVKKEVDPVKEFADELKRQGVLVKGDPIMDGKWHRVQLDGDAKGQNNASYRAFLDGRANGQIHNYKTQETHKWVATGEALTKEQRAKLEAEAAQKQQQRAEERLKLQKEARFKAMKRFDEAFLPKLWKPGQDIEPDDYPYLNRKGVGAYGIHQEPSGTLLVPARTVDGQLWSVQTIDHDGTKRFPKNARKSGLMHIIDPDNKIEEKSSIINGSGMFKESKLGKGTIVIGEGYATAATLHEATKRPVIVAFDAGNLVAVAQAVRERHPNATIVIAGDNDHKLESKRQGNVGKERAEDAALAVGGFVAVPQFTETQKRAGLTDWNDLANAEGDKAVLKQMKQQLSRQRYVQLGHKPNDVALEM